jgi:ABC-type antimicrobial peptide transport system permease subunit
MVSMETIRLAVAGIAFGLPAGLLLGRWLRSQLFAVGAGDPGVLLAGAATILFVVTIAALLPARRAARLDPEQALRTEST